MASSNNVITRPFLRLELNRFGKKLKTEIKSDLLKALKSDLYEIKDEIVGEFKKATEDQQVHQFSHRRINDDLSELTERVDKLEKTASSA